MLAIFSKWVATLGLGLAAAITGVSAPADNTATTTNQVATSYTIDTTDVTPIDNPVTGSELGVSLHNKITDLRDQVEKVKLDERLPLIRPLMLGSRGDDVSALQDMLETLNYLSDNPSGFYGPDTMKAVGDFQRDFQLTATGVVDRSTLDMIFDIIVSRMDLASIYFPEEGGLVGVATSSEKELADALNESCPAADPELIYVPSDPIVQVETQTVYVQPNPVTLSVSGANTAFTPKTLYVAKGTPVTIHFTVTSGTHNFVIDAFGLHVATTTSSLAHDGTFTASATGTFQYYSSVGSDKASGMTGTLTIY